MKLFKIPAGTPCVVGNPSLRKPSRDWLTSHENIFALEDMLEDPLKHYEHLLRYGAKNPSLDDCTYTFRDHETKWEITVMYQYVEVLA